MLKIDLSIHFSELENKTRVRLKTFTKFIVFIINKLLILLLIKSNETLIAVIIKAFRSGSLPERKDDDRNIVSRYIQVSIIKCKIHI